MSPKPPCPGKNSIEEKKETDFWSEEDGDGSDEDEDTVEIQVGSGTRAGVHVPRRLVFAHVPMPVLVPTHVPVTTSMLVPRLKRQVAVPGYCSMCGRLTSESAPNVEGDLYYCYTCYDNP